MRKTKIALFMVLTVILSSCSMLEGINNTLNYANEVSTFVNEVPVLAEQATTDEQAAKDLEQRLEDMKQDIKEFNDLEEPSVGADLHQQVVDRNNQALEGIDVYLNNMENGKLDSSVIEDTEIFQTLRDISNTIDQIKKLGG
ncbi:DUF6376 family protein [Halobacillus campisalis]|uniref:DUF6376 family protein n=1 Tax=Halobacillus campisalis TaxID=435909 RepID=A0ABW2K384_9BACI|nr:DUF6376 family protein [Halobacillus campisalis]